MSFASNAATLVATLKNRNETLTTAESCTGGLLADAFVSVPGASACYTEGFVTYCNEAKMHLLHVKEETLLAYTAVSSQTAAEMALGARENANTTYSLSTTGLAGPDGGTKDCPVGTVFLGCAYPGGVLTQEMHFFGDRQSIRHQAVEASLHLLETVVAQQGDMPCA